MSIKVGDLYPVWWSTESTPPNKARILEIKSYRGRYPQDFNAVLRLSAPGTKQGWLEMAVKIECETNT